MKPRNNPMPRLGLAALLVLVSIMLTVGVAWGRYRTELEPFEYWFAPRTQESVYLWGGKENDSYTPLPGSWTVGESESILPFLVSNGISSEFSENDVQITVQLAATEGILSADNLTLQLAVVDGETEPVYTAKAEAIGQDTALYDEFGAGWLYRFYDEEGKELTRTLKGGQLSEFSGELHVSGSLDSKFYSMLQLQVIGIGG